MKYITHKEYSKEELIELVKYPLLTDKTTKLIEENQYSFAVSKKANKPIIKQAIEYIFQVKVKSINTSNQPHKKRKVGKFIGRKSSYKKAIVTLHDGNTIKLFPDN
uniref:Large ribosomal subunit protein uL23c n=1 Tax=Gelidium vagum TaxID=35171 RepID=A0A141SEE5_GELVA|nr:ribosomal protein L23 [Gelidium vagum]AMK96663.1 ribosomal protein L23 [Gelidium vagum]